MKEKPVFVVVVLCEVSPRPSRIVRGVHKRSEGRHKGGVSVRHLYNVGWAGLAESFPFYWK